MASAIGATSTRGSEIRIGFRSGWIRSVAMTAGGAGVLGVAFGAFSLAEKRPAILDLLTRWGPVWLLALAAMLLLWDLARIGLAYMGRLADSVQQTALAMNRIADKDDRERDRMVTETAFVGQRIERLTDEIRADRADRNARDQRFEAILTDLAKGQRT